MVGCAFCGSGVDPHECLLRFAKPPSPFVTLTVQEMAYAKRHAAELYRLARAHGLRWNARRPDALDAGYAAELAARSYLRAPMVLTIRPPWEERGVDLEFRGRSIQNKLNLSPGGPWGPWFYCPSDQPELEAEIGVLVTTTTASRTFHVARFILRERFEAIKRPCPFDRTARGVPPSELEPIERIWSIARRNTAA